MRFRMIRNNVTTAQYYVTKYSGYLIALLS